jgi:peptidase E
MVRCFLFHNNTNTTKTPTNTGSIVARNLMVFLLLSVVTDQAAIVRHMVSGWQFCAIRSTTFTKNPRIFRNTNSFVTKANHRIRKEATSGSIFSSAVIRWICTTNKDTNNNPIQEAVSTSNIPHGLLFSSFTEGVKPSKEAAAFIKKVLIQAMVSEVLAEQQNEDKLISSATQPNITTFLQKLVFDQQQEEEDNNNINSNKTIIDLLVAEPTSSTTQIQTNISTTSSHANTSQPPLVELPLRLLYIPTAMYALRKDSLNTPGKQRQRARADAKSRRDTIVQYLQSLFHNSDNPNKNTPIGIHISALTLDVEDGSLKHPFCTTTTTTAAASSSSSPSSSANTNNKNNIITISKNNNNINITSFLHSYSPHIIYVDGGNTFWLHHCLRHNNNYYWDAIVQFCSKKATTNNSKSVLYCGQSAGAIVAGSYVETATWKGWDDPSIVPGMEHPQSWKGIPGMNLFQNNISIFPHYSKEWEELVTNRNRTDFTTMNNGTTTTTTTTTTTNLICLSDSEVLAITGGQYVNNNNNNVSHMQIFSSTNSLSSTVTSLL